MFERLQINPLLPCAHLAREALGCSAQRL